MLFDDIDQQNKYHQVWKGIFKNINGGHGELKLHEKIRLYYNDLPIKQVFKIHSITVAIKSLIEKNKDPQFTYYARLANILDFNPEKIRIEKVRAINDELEYIYYVKYNNNSFYLVIDDLKGYFKYSNEEDEKKSEFIIEDQMKKKFII